MPEVIACIGVVGSPVSCASNQVAIKITLIHIVFGVAIVAPNSLTLCINAQQFVKACNIAKTNGIGLQVLPGSGVIFWVPPLGHCFASCYCAIGASLRNNFIAKLFDNRLDVVIQVWAQVCCPVAKCQVGKRGLASISFIFY